MEIKIAVVALALKVRRVYQDFKVHKDRKVRLAWMENLV
jgi:hypothetical protein